MTFNEWRNEHTKWICVIVFHPVTSQYCSCSFICYQTSLAEAKKSTPPATTKKRETECVIIIIHAYHWLFVRIYMKFMANWLCIVRLIILSTELLFSWAKPSWLTDSFVKPGCLLDYRPFLYSGPMWIWRKEPVVTHCLLTNSLHESCD